MSRFEVIESRVWTHKPTGRRASIYGACPWTRSDDAPNWSIQSQGWTVRNPLTGQVGACRQPFATKAEAEAFAERVRPSAIGYGD